MLIWMSILITVAALIFASMLPGKEAGDNNLKTIDDIHKLERIEEAMRSFMATHLRRPCPADGKYPITSSYFGQEAGTPGTCYGNTAPTPNASMGPDSNTTLCNNNTTGCIVSGVVPTRSLGLDESYQFDSYGRQITYVVDMRATNTGSCLALEGITGSNFTPTGSGGLIIKNTTGGTTIDNVMYAYILHGPSGYGAFPEQGSAVGARIQGSTDVDMQTNAGVDATGVNSTFTYNSTNFTNVRIQKDPTFPSTGGGNLDTGFSDILWYRPDIKNTCCLGPKCIPQGFRVDGQSSGGNNTNDMAVLAVGDINGDGYPDLVVGSDSGGNHSIYVIFGTSKMGGSSSSPWPIPPTGLDPTTLNGTNGFIINSPSYVLYNTVIIGDLNGDGYGDIIIGGIYKKAFIVFGGPGGCQASTTLCNLSSTTPWLPSGNTLTLSNLVGYRGPLDGTHTGNTGNGISGVVINQTNAAGNGIFTATKQNFTPYGLEIGKVDDSRTSPTVAGCTTTTCMDLIAAGVVCCPSGNAYGGYVIYGMPTYTGSGGDWYSTGSLDATTLNGSNGFQFYSSDPGLFTGLLC